ncbi:MAG: hypothetical protein ACI85H_001487, partial [Paracoccaceae bacterium]
GDQDFSFIKYAKLWIDIINSRFSEFNTDQSGRKIWSVEFFESIAAFKVNKEASGLKSEFIWNTEETPYDGDFRNVDNGLTNEKVEEIKSIILRRFSNESPPGNKQITLTKNQFFELVNSYIEQKPGNRDELIGLLSKSSEI